MSIIGHVWCLVTISYDVLMYTCYIHQKNGELAEQLVLNVSSADVSGYCGVYLESCGDG